MKKSFAVAVCVMAFLAFTASAKSKKHAESSFRIGARGTFQINAGSVIDDEKISNPTIEVEKSVDQKLLAGGGAGIFATISLPDLENLSIQPEINLMFNNGFKYSEKDSTYIRGTGIMTKSSSENTVSYTSLEIPILAVYTFKIDDFDINPLAGPNFSFPVGKAKYATDISDDATGDVDSHFILGILFGADAVWNIDNNNGVVGGLRYLIDLTRFSSDDQKIGFRRQLQMNLGYRYSF